MMLVTPVLLASNHFMFLFFLFGIHEEDCTHLLHIIHACFFQNLNIGHWDPRFLSKTMLLLWQQR
jgi:hypothetical protein